MHLRQILTLILVEVFCIDFFFTDEQRESTKSCAGQSVCVQHKANLH